jgi:hypothetical protein
MLSSTINHLQKTMRHKTYSLGQVIPVLSGSNLLDSSQHQNLIQELATLCGLDDNQFKFLYRSAINQYAEFVQLLPEEPNTPFGGLLNMGLARAALAMRQFENPDPLTLYAVFTATLFYDVARAVSQQRIIICDEQGKYQQEWYPYAGSMVEYGAEHYKIYPFNTNEYAALNNESAAILARQLMPRDGFVWLSSHLELFIDWLEAIRGEQRQEGRRIGRAVSLIRQEDLLALARDLQQGQSDLPQVKDLNLLDQFYLWLQEGIADGSIQINTKEANVHYLEEGVVYLNNEVFKRFHETVKIPESNQNLIREFNEQFGIATHVMYESKVNSTFLSQSWEPKVTQGTLAFASQFIMDYTGIPVSPLQERIKSGTKTAIKEGRINPHQVKAPDTIKQSMQVEQRQPSSSNFSFKMR